MRKITIAGRNIGDGFEPFIVAEAGINHNGDLERAFKMIEVAKAAGADAIKFQIFKAEEVVGDPDQQFSYFSQGKPVTESMQAMFKRYEFPLEYWPKLKQKCDEVGIIFFATPQNRTDLDVLVKVGVPAVKVGSDDFVNLPLLKSYTETKLPIILSSGLSNAREVEDALAAAGTKNGYPTVLLVCTSQYPTPDADVNVLRVKTLRDAYPELPIGFSDHTQSATAAAMATALGACVFEKHFTLDRDLPGPDHWFSETPDTLKIWVDTIRSAYVMRGSGVVEPSATELKQIKDFRRILVAARDIAKGTILSEADFVMRRMAGDGLLPKELPKFVGKAAASDISKDHIMQLTDAK